MLPRSANQLAMTATTLAHMSYFDSATMEQLGSALAVSDGVLGCVASPLATRHPACWLRESVGRQDKGWVIISWSQAQAAAAKYICLLSSTYF
jgi:hypothetical protein